MAKAGPVHAVIRPCRKCGRDIFFVQSVNGRPMPLDVEPVQDAVIVLEERPAGEDGLAQVHYRGHVGPAFTSHFATCPDAASFRRSR